jgi:murein DD-endopeptidase MepM/ murein hydrolase activator NlpD
LRRKNNGSFLGLFVVLVVVAAALFVYFSPTFERVAPEIQLENNGYWNLKKPLTLTIKDNTGVAAYRVILRTASGDKELSSEQLLLPQNEVKLEVQAPRGAYLRKQKEVSVIIQARDGSKWNLFKGNSALKVYKLIIDKKRPRVTILTNSYKISRGGSALVVFSAEDPNLDSIFIETSFGKKFKAEPFYKEGYYIALLAWPVTTTHFKATVVATDNAGNVAKAYVPLYLKNRSYKVSKINLSDRFLKGKIYDLAEEFEETEGVDDKLEQFKIINEDVRAKNEALIHKITSQVPQEMISDFKVRRMYPLKNGMVVAHFGDHRKYYYDGVFISEAYHLGLDLASHAQAPIVSQNSGKVVFADFNGLYGNMPVISHGLGLYTIYGHCSSIEVNVGDEVHPGEKIANTGKSGYAMGDHLHFGVLVQGVEVRPQEWMDRKWIKTNIDDIIKNAKKIINNR